METLLTLEMVTLVNGLAIQHSSEWEDYVEMNAQIHGLTKEEYTAYYLGTQWQMQCMESLQRLTEKKVTRKQLDKAINDLAKITNDLKKVVKEWAAARDAGKTEKQEEKLQELKKLNDEKTAAQKVVDDHIQQLDKNATLQTTEDLELDIELRPSREKMSVTIPGDFEDNEGEKAVEDELKNQNKEYRSFRVKDIKLKESMNEKKSEFKEGDRVKLTLKGLQQMNRDRTPGISNSYSRSLGKIRDKDITGTVERVFPSGSMNVDFDGVLYDIKDYMVVKESVNEKYRETRHQSTDFSKPGNDGDIYFSKREGSAVGVKRGDKLQMIYVFQKEPKLGKIQKSDKRWKNMGPASEKLLIDLRGREEGKIMFDFVSTLEESVNEAVSRSTKIYCVATPAPQKMLVQELENIFGDDYRNIVTEFTDDEGYESVLLFNLTKNDIASIQKRVADVLIWEYSIKKGKEIMESVNEKIQVASLEDAIEAEQGGDLNKRHLDKILKLKAAKRMHTMTRAEEKTYQAILRKYKIAMDDVHVGDMMEAIDIDMINTEYGFWGTMADYHDEEQVEIATEEAITVLTSRYGFTQDGVYNFLNSKWGRKLADEYLDGQYYNMIDAIEAFTRPSTYKKYAKEFNEAKENTMKNLQTLESFINEATVVMDAMDPKSKILKKLLKKHKVTMKVLDPSGPSGLPEVELTGSREDLQAVLASPDGWDDPELGEYIEEATEETVKEGKDKWIVYDTESKEILEIYKDLKAAEAFADKQKNAEVAAADFYHSRIKENTMKNLQTLESFINEAAPKLKTSKEEAGLLKLRDEIRRSSKGGSASRYSKEFDAAKKKALKAIEQMITYASIGV